MDNKLIRGALIGAVAVIMLLGSFSGGFLVGTSLMVTAGLGGAGSTLFVSVGFGLRVRLVRLEFRDLGLALAAKGIICTSNVRSSDGTHDVTNVSNPSA